MSTVTRAPSIPPSRAAPLPEQTLVSKGGSKDRRRARIATLAALLAGLVGTIEVTDAAESADSLTAVDIYRCALADKLREIAGRVASPEGADRFIVIEIPDGSYVQCIFVRGVHEMTCEAQSRWWSATGNVTPTAGFSASQLARLRMLGFATDVADGNFSQTVPSGGEEGRQAIADLMLRTLADVYGALPGESIRYTAPMADAPAGSLERNACPAVSKL